MIKVYTVRSGFYGPVFQQSIIKTFLFIFRGEISSVILYDTSNDEDININEAILQAIKEEGGGIDTPRTLSPAPGSNSPTPKQVISPVQSATNLTDNVKRSSSQSLRSSEKSDSQTSVSSKTKSSEKLDSSPKLTESRDTLNIGRPEITGISEAKAGSNEALPTQVTLQTSVIDKDVIEDKISEIPRFSSSWTNPTQDGDNQRDSKKVDHNSNVNNTNNVINDIENLNLSNQNEEVPSLTNQYVASDHVISNEPMKAKEWTRDGRTVWNPVEYSKRPLPPNFKIPPLGEYLDIHVNFIHDPSNFVVSKLECDAISGKNIWARLVKANYDIS